MKKTIFFALLTTASSSFANGGPIETSPVFGTGNAGPVQFVQRDVELVSEDIVFTPGVNFVDVQVTYILHNYGEDLQTGYCFPVTATKDTADDWTTDDFNQEEDVRNFTILQDGMELPVNVLERAESDSTVSEYGWEVPVITHLYITDLSIPGDGNVRIDVSYSVRATYEDFQTTKDFFPRYEDRRFRYDLKPAALWGDGVVETFTMTINTTELHALQGSLVLLPEGGEWMDSNTYTVREENFNLAQAPDIHFTFQSRTEADSRYIEHYRIPPESYTITTSSQLDDSYGTGNLSDGDMSTAWCEGAPGTTGEWIEIRFGPDVNIAWVGIVPGYGKTEYTYSSNARPVEVSVTVEIPESYPDSYTCEIPEVPWETIERGLTSEIYREVFNRGESYPVRSLRITFDEAIPGTEFDDLCISELIVAGWTYP